MLAKSETSQVSPPWKKRGGVGMGTYPPQKNVKNSNWLSSMFLYSEQEFPQLESTSSKHMGNKEYTITIVKRIINF